MQEEKNFCHNVKILRERRSLSKTEMARMMRISEQALAEIENGRIPDDLSVEVLFYIQEYCGIPCADLLGKLL